MKNIIRITAVLVCAAALSVPLASCVRASTPSASSGADVSASVSPAPESSPSGHHHWRSPFFRALHELTLTPEQKTQIKGFMKAASQANESATPEQKRANTAKLHDQILGVLTADQRQQLQASIAQKKRTYHKGHMMMMSPAPTQGGETAVP